jgi:hypothetical protein
MSPRGRAGALSRDDFSRVILVAGHYKWPPHAVQHALHETLAPHSFANTPTGFLCR